MSVETFHRKLLDVIVCPISSQPRCFQRPDPGDHPLPDVFIVHLQDGRSLTVPIEWFPRLRDATPEQRSHWRLIGHGIGIHWPDIDEDISVVGLPD